MKNPDRRKGMAGVKWKPPLLLYPPGRILAGNVGVENTSPALSTTKNPNRLYCNRRRRG
jgi:hypothetical protein